MVSDRDPLGLDPSRPLPGPSNNMVMANMGALPPTRKRSSRACDGCKQRRMKCEDIMPSPTTNEPTCKLCREAGVDCTFDTPVRKRGPAPGFRRRAGSPRKSEEEGEGSGTEGGAARTSNGSTGESSERKPPSSDRPVAPPGRRRRPPLLGLPPALVDELLAVYFTHVHNVWPLIYKPMFNPHTTSAPLLLSMLSIAACVAHPSGKDGLDSDKLFAMAESALHHCRTESRIDILQALMVLSLRQTGCGDKRSAFSYTGRASIMALNLGLHLAPTGPSEPGDLELRSRVYWNAYVLDKVLAEETGRCTLLPYRRSSTPMPSTDEADEFEPWPPQTASSAPLPRSVRHVPPRRGHVISFFVWTCRLAMIVEDILDLEITGPPVINRWDEDFVAYMHAEGDVVTRAEVIGRKLEMWRRMMPKHLEVDLAPAATPLPHHVVGIAWFHCIRILLYNRFIKRHPSPSRAGAAELVERAHNICSQSAEECVDLLAHLDRHKLLGQVSADVIHLLSIITLFEAFDATDPDEALAHRAKVNFAQCCIWLRDFSASWPAASAHKVFFEGLIQGGLRISSGDLDAENTSPDGTAPGGNGSGHGGNGGGASGFSPETPEMPEELRMMGRNLSSGRTGSMTGATPATVSGTPGSTSGNGGGGGGGGRHHAHAPHTAEPLQGSAPSLFQLPQFYWNQMTTVPTGEGVSEGAEQRFDWDLDLGASGSGATPDQLPPQPAWDAGSTGAGSSAAGGGGVDRGHNGAGGSSHAAHFMPPHAPWDGHGGGHMMDASAGPHAHQHPHSPHGNADQASIYAALMSYMVEAAKTN